MQSLKIDVELAWNALSSFIIKMKSRKNAEKGFATKR